MLHLLQPTKANPSHRDALGFMQALTARKSDIHPSTQIPCCPPSKAETLPTQTGNYVLVLKLPRERGLMVGRLRCTYFPPGWYLYVGSAGGPGGLRARVRRHLKAPSEKRWHWHIDALTSAAFVWDVWWVEGEVNQECRWAETLADVGQRHPAGFGASDCRCPGHLIHLMDTEHLDRSWRRLQHEFGSELYSVQCITKQSRIPLDLEEEQA
jgi:Uri superfamily endonuclease